MPGGASEGDGVGGGVGSIAVVLGGIGEVERFFGASCCKAVAVVVGENGHEAFVGEGVESGIIGAGASSEAESDCVVVGCAVGGAALLDVVGGEVVGQGSVLLEIDGYFAVEEEELAEAVGLDEVDGFPAGEGLVLGIVGEIGHNFGYLEVKKSLGKICKLILD